MPRTLRTLRTPLTSPTRTRPPPSTSTSASTSRRTPRTPPPRPTPPPLTQLPWSGPTYPRPTVSISTTPPPGTTGAHPPDDHPRVHPTPQRSRRPSYLKESIHHGERSADRPGIRSRLADEWPRPAGTAHHQRGTPLLRRAREVGPRPRPRQRRPHGGSGLRPLLPRPQRRRPLRRRRTRRAGRRRTRLDPAVRDHRGFRYLSRRAGRSGGRRG